MAEIENIKSKANIAHIKSPFILKLLFSFLTKTQKLKMVAYNKELQNIYLVDINDYKEISSKYKIGGKNGKGREYIIKSNILKFEGEYINGKGKEYYDNSKLLFEGEYLNGERNGKGKEYNYDNGKLLFEGEYLNGKRNGKGKEYNYGGILIFEGEYLNGNKI